MHRDSYVALGLVEVSFRAHISEGEIQCLIFCVFSGLEILKNA